jgi:hypothetical protein
VIALQVFGAVALAVTFLLFASIAAVTAWDVALGDTQGPREDSAQAVVAASLALISGGLLCLTIL